MSKKIMYIVEMKGEGEYNRHEILSTLLIVLGFFRINYL